MSSATLEEFSRKPPNIDLAEGQYIVPIKLDEDSASLSAILLNDDYYALVRQQHNEKNLPFANPAALIPLKARACLDFMERAAKGEKGKGKEIAKHRTDVFRIAATPPVKRDRPFPDPFKRICESFFPRFPPKTKNSGKRFTPG